ncbi:hypothetical protein L484_005903 [Morus notabilis]|uniref:Uncharacterized protein n=1 Tax=Morus notabilis TaxID=981085 RepID=W9QLQ2_9ROSA|nr:hypothetical protein L484_005903 [Morus notabilis]
MDLILGPRLTCTGTNLGHCIRTSVILLLKSMFYILVCSVLRTFTYRNAIEVKSSNSNYSLQSRGIGLVWKSSCSNWYNYWILHRLRA